MRKIRIAMCTLLMMLIMVAQVAAEAPEKIVLEKNHSTYLDLWGLDSVAIANPEIADITVLSGREILVIGKAQGSTSLQVTFQSGNRREYSVVVTDGDRDVATAIEGMINYSNVTVAKVGDNIVLDGTVEDQLEKKRAETIAGMYATKVVNLLEMENPKQIRIEAKIVEIDSDKIDKIGIQYFNASEVKKNDLGGASITPGANGSFLMGQSLGEGPYGWFGSYMDINANLMMLVNNGNAKVLSQPNMVTMSGEKANILIGGEIPVPINNSDGQISVEWHPYGIKLKIEPNVGVDSQITGKVFAEVSSLDTTSAAAINLTSGLSIPALRSRQAETVVTMHSGNTMAIGGLITSEDSKQISKIPLLGDLPVIGQFFRNTIKNKERREIIILITPTLVDDTYQTPMSHKLKTFIDDKSAEEVKLAKDPEVVKQEEAEAEKQAKLAAETAKQAAKEQAEIKAKADAKAQADAKMAKQKAEKQAKLAAETAEQAAKEQAEIKAKADAKAQADAKMVKQTAEKQAKLAAETAKQAAKEQAEVKVQADAKRAKTETKPIKTSEASKKATKSAEEIVVSKKPINEVITESKTADQTAKSITPAAPHKGGKPDADKVK